MICMVSDIILCHMATDIWNLGDTHQNYLRNDNMSD